MGVRILLRSQPVRAFSDFRRYGVLGSAIQPAKGAEVITNDEDKFNMTVRKFLKVVGITAQREKAA